MSGYIGNIPVPQATQTRDNFTATASQTTFATSGYTPGYLDVYLNGVHLDPTDYTAANGTDVVLATGATAGDVLSVVAFTTFQVAGPAGAGYFLGENGATGDTTNGLGDIFRVHEDALDTAVTIAANTNASATGPLTLNATVTVNGTLTIV